MQVSLTRLFFQDSLDTVISKDKQSWEEPTYEEQEELQDLPRPLHAWASPPHNVVLDIESTGRFRHYETTILYKEPPRHHTFLS